MEKNSIKYYRILNELFCIILQRARLFCHNCTPCILKKFFFELFPLKRILHLFLQHLGINSGTYGENPSVLFSKLHFQSAHEILEEDCKTIFFSNFNFRLSKTISDFWQKNFGQIFKLSFYPAEFRGWMYFLKKTS